MFAFWGRWKQACADRAEARMERWGWSVPTRDYAWHAWTLFMEQGGRQLPPGPASDVGVPGEAITGCQAPC